MALDSFVSKNSIPHHGVNKKKHAKQGVLKFFGAPSLTRTDDLSLTRRLLYQLSY